MKIVAYTFIALIASCGTTPSTNPNLIPGFKPGPAPKNGMQIIMPPVEDIQPGQSEELCSVTDIQLTDTIDISKVAAAQAAGGHHVALYWSKNPGSSDAHVCTDADMVNFRFVAGANNVMDTEAPGSIAFEIPAGAYIAVQQHFINATDGPMTSQSVLNLYYTDPGQNYTPSHGLAFLNTTLDLNPGQDTLDIHCTMQNDVKAWMVMPHMHKYGTVFTEKLTHAGTVTMLENQQTWSEAWEFEAPITNFDPANPLVFHTGDTVDVHCEWDNTSSSVLHFGDEMCVAFAQTVDDTNLGNLACDAGDWVPF